MQIPVLAVHTHVQVHVCLVVQCYWHSKDLQSTFTEQALVEQAKLYTQIVTPGSVEVTEISFQNH